MAAPIPHDREVMTGILKQPALTVDETAMVLGTLVVGVTRCGLKANDHPLEGPVARLGHNLADFETDNGRYRLLVMDKMERAHEWIKTQGQQKACDGLVSVVRKLLPDVVR